MKKAIKNKGTLRKKLKPPACTLKEATLQKANPEKDFEKQVAEGIKPHFLKLMKHTSTRSLPDSGINQALKKDKTTG